MRCLLALNILGDAMKTRKCPKCGFPMMEDHVEWYCDYCDYSELVDIKHKWKLED